MLQVLRTKATNNEERESSFSSSQFAEECSTESGASTEEDWWVQNKLSFWRGRNNHGQDRSPLFKVVANISRAQ